MTPLAIIEKWCKIADEQQLKEHRIAFWRIRDILEGNDVSRENGIESFFSSYV